MEIEKKVVRLVLHVGASLVERVCTRVGITQLDVERIDGKWHFSAGLGSDFVIGKESSMGAALERAVTTLWSSSFGAARREQELAEQLASRKPAADPSVIY